MKPYEKLIRERRSVRTYDERPLTTEVLQKLREQIDTITNPFDIPVVFRLLDAKEHGLSSPVLVGESLYAGAKVTPADHWNEAFGYSFEKLILGAQSLGLGTVWIGGTMNRAIFEKAMALENGEVMPCVTPVGYAAAKMSIRETLMRKGVKADWRMPFEELFFSGSWDHPLTAEQAGALACPLEMVRLGPSAVNKQPWRAVVTGDTVHFYLKRNKDFAIGKSGDMQKIDAGIALCHFDLTAQDAGLNPRFLLSDPGLPLEEGMEYIASYRFTLL